MALDLKNLPALEGYKLSAIRINYENTIHKLDNRIKCGVCGKVLSKKGRKICIKCVEKRLKARYKF